MALHLRLICLLMLMLPGAASADTYYLSPAGRDDADAGRSLPAAFRTFGFAIPHLRPGDTLMVDRGTYTPADGGLLHVVCPTDAPRGTPDASINVRALEERQSVLRDEGNGSAILLDGCDYWNISGLTAIASDRQAEKDWGAAVRIWNLHHVVADKLLVQGNNRYSKNSAGIDIASTSFVTLQDSEVYDFSSEGVSFWQNTDCVVRRVYLNSRQRPSIDAGYVGADNDLTRGDVGVSLLGSRHVVENTISEGQRVGFAFSSFLVARQNLVAGTISLDEYVGATLVTEPSTTPIDDTRLVDFLCVRPVSIGLQASGASRTTVARSSFFGGGWGVIADRPVPIDGGTSITVLQSLASGQTTTAFTFIGQDSWSLNDSAALLGGRALDAPDAGGRVLDLWVGDAGLGSACFAYQLASSPLQGAARDGGDIGAQLLYRFEGGVLTDTPLWNPATGQFPCGAIVSGINDLPDASCRDVHVRLRVGAFGCALPYSQDGGGVVELKSRTLTVGCGCGVVSPDALLLLLVLVSARRAARAIDA